MKKIIRIVSIILLQAFLLMPACALSLSADNPGMLSPRLNIEKTLIKPSCWQGKEKLPLIERRGYSFVTAQTKDTQEEFPLLLENVFAGFVEGLDAEKPDIDQVLKKFMKLCIGKTRAAYGSILIKDKEKPFLHFEYFTGPASRKLRYLSIPDDVGISGQVIETKKPMIANEDTIYQMSRVVDKFTDFTTNNLLCFPVIAGGKVIALLELVNKPGGFKKEDITVIEALFKEYQRKIEEALRYKEQKAAFLAACIKLADEIEAKNLYTGGHVLRVKRYVLMIAEEMGLTDKEKYEFQIAAILHDVGKKSIPDAILDKEGPLTKEEFKAMKMHAPLGSEYLNNLYVHDVPFRDILGRFVDVANIEKGIVFHHERIDGKGYFGLTGDEIPAIAKIIAVADVFDALTSDRPYHKGISFEAAIRELNANKELQVCPEVVEAFTRVLQRKKNLNDILVQENLIEMALSDNPQIVERALADFRRFEGVKAKRFERDYLLGHQQGEVVGFWELRYLLGEKNTDLIIDSIIRNTLKYGKGTAAVIVRILDNTRLRLVIQDNGYGFDLADVEPKIGISPDVNGEISRGKSSLWNLVEMVVKECRGKVTMRSHDKYKVFFPSDFDEGWRSKLIIDPDVNKGLRIEVSIPIPNKFFKPKKAELGQQPVSQGSVLLEQAI